MVSHQPARFSGHRHCRSGDKMFLVIEEQDSEYSCLNPPSLFLSKGNGLKAYNVSDKKADPGLPV